MFTFFFILFALAGRALAFNITLGNNVFQAGDIMNIPGQDVPSQCTDKFTAAKQGMDNCNQDPGCLCKDAVVNTVRIAQQCMFEHLVSTNSKPSDIRVGSNPLLAAYSASCKTDVNVTLAANISSLAVPAIWDGPFDAVLPVGGTVVTVIAGGMLGMFALLVLSNMS